MTNSEREMMARVHLDTARRQERPFCVAMVRDAIANGVALSQLLPPQVQSTNVIAQIAELEAELQFLELKLEVVRVEELARTANELRSSAIMRDGRLVLSEPRPSIFLMEKAKKQAEGLMAECTRLGRVANELAKRVQIVHQDLSAWIHQIRLQRAREALA